MAARETRHRLSSSSQVYAFPAINNESISNVPLFLFSPIVPVTRKGAIKKVTTFYCDKIRNEKLEAYKKELENEKVRFAEEKAVIEKWIDEEEKQLGLRN